MSVVGFLKIKKDKMMWILIAIKVHRFTLWKWRLDSPVTSNSNRLVKVTGNRAIYKEIVYIVFDKKIKKS